MFHGFTGGIGILTGATGGYIFGFILSGIFFILISARLVSKPMLTLISAFAGLVICYLTGTLWFCLTASRGTGFASALLTCVVPFIIPDVIKILLAFFIAQRLKKFRCSA